MAGSNDMGRGNSGTYFGGTENDVVISSRVRFARNIADYPFASRLDPTSASEIIEKVTGIFSGEGYKTEDFTKISPAVAASYVEKHYVSPEFVNSSLPRVLITNQDRNLEIMVCEEDHIRLQSIMNGLSLDEAYQNACYADDMLCGGLNIAYDENLGFLTHCPTNLGMGMRASVMLFLPALTMTKQIDGYAAALAKIGLTIRGMYGEGSEASGCLYQVSNQATLGMTEEDTIKKLSEVTAQIIANERKTRDAMKSDSSDRLADLVFRALGTLKYARLISSKEFLKLFAEVRLGIALGYITEIGYGELSELLVSVMPANLTIKTRRELTDAERDRERADFIRHYLTETK